MIRLNNDYFVEVDALNYALCKDIHRTTTRTNKETGEVTTVPVYKTIGYYGDLEQCLQAFGKQLIRDKLTAAECDLRGAVEIIRQSNEELTNTIKECMRYGSTST